jgi:hypothetical protein
MRSAAPGVKTGRAVVVIFRVDVPGLLPASVTEVEVKLQEDAVGTPEQVSETLLVKTGVGDRVT